MKEEVDKSTKSEKDNPAVISLSAVSLSRLISALYNTRRFSHRDGQEKPEEQVRQAGRRSIGAVARGVGGLREDPVRDHLDSVLYAVRGLVRW